ncbi:MAG: AraC family transcriptional regulator [Polyangiaceae bacterium]|nr:AraC family transcriptional regulator [Polyangiaceae bacterium]
MNHCIACGMPMMRAEDHALSDTSKEYCKHCARPDGSMRSYDEAVVGMTQWMVRTQGIDAEVAKQMAVETLKSLPAWKSTAT